MLRRHLLAGAAVGVSIPGSAFDEAPTPYASVVPRLEAVLLGNPSMFTAPAAPSTIQKHLTAVKEDYQAARYIRLGRRLTQLLRTAEATATTKETPRAAALYAEALNVATHTLIKFDVEGLAWVSADRAMTAARAAGDPVAAAEATRMLCIVARRCGHHARARQLAVDAAARLADTGDVSPRAISLYGSLLSTAGYTSARAGDAGTAATLLDEADSAAARLGRDGNEHWSTFGPTSVSIYRVSAALALDDPAAALVVARTVHAGRILTPERRGRFWVDVASAYAQTGRPDASFRALRAAEHAAPEEILARPAVRSLVGHLVQDHRGRVPDELHAFAGRGRRPVVDITWPGRFTELCQGSCGQALPSAWAVSPLCLRAAAQWRRDVPAVRA